MLQETHKYFLFDQYLAAKQRSKRRLILFFSGLVHDQRGLRHRNRHMAWAWPRLQNWFRMLLAK